ncbi:MAG: glycosyl hydrolase family 18 protein [Candidatus Gracilibacteria bacterium]|jgi:hypothetical protein
MIKSKKVVTLGIVFIAFALIWVFFIGFSGNAPGSIFNRENNAVWIAHEWVGEEKSDVDIQRLVGDFQKHQIGTVFVHVGPLNEDGTIDPVTYQHAMNFIYKARLFDENIQYQAWLGQLRNKIDLADPDVRHNVANQAFIMTNLVGFDGVHFDIEPVWDGDENFILTLKESRELVGNDKVISVALAEFIPKSIIWLTQKIHKFENYNTEINYKNVAQYADQLVVMVYDTGLDKEWKYRWLVKEQTIWVTDLFNKKEVFIAIPSYDDVKAGFDPLIENIGNGLEGIIEGLNNTRSDEGNFAGVAIYPYWEISDDEWGIYDNLWLGK